MAVRTENIMKKKERSLKSINGTRIKNRVGITI